MNLAFAKVLDVHVVVHTKENPTDAEWDSYLNELALHAKAIGRILVYSVGGGPNALQRARLRQVFGDSKSRPVALITSSLALRGVLKAITWLMPGIRTKAFAPDERSKALSFLELDPATLAAVEKGLMSLSAQLSVDLKA